MSRSLDSSTILALYVLVASVSYVAVDRTEKVVVMACQALPHSSKPQMEIRSAIPLSERCAKIPSTLWTDLKIQRTVWRCAMYDYT